ncbi:unnamed protein product [Periconia digitata]|uniref:Telomere-associated protein Rif1 N-terminal domain-containing protein n=1 Tax=Periconia digitata TaxID=1303443 RepID=A0A9W4UA88_9PLEO|nr:unnamed protein product [Periconia digitata]
MVSPFRSLCVRPPTPPPAKTPADDTTNNQVDDQDADELLNFLNDPFGTKDPASKPVVSSAQKLLSTPRSSPASDSAVPLSSASRRKRVLFEPKPSAIPSTGFVQQTSTPLHSSPLRPLPQTRVSKPLKSILKPIDPTSTPPSADQSAPAHTFKSFAEMLESITKQLAAPSRASRMDAYNTLHRTMQAFDKIPDVQALVDKLGLLTQFVQRDMQAKGANDSGLDSQLVGQALKLLMALLRIPELRSAMEDSFCIFVVERILQVASDKDMPKTVVNTHLATLMQQNFRSKVMTVSRVERILTMIDTIPHRVSGQSVLAYRIRIYKKLLQQKPDVMAKHTDQWFKHLLQSLLSVQKDINQSALETTLTAARTIGTDPHVTQSVLAVLNHRKKDGETVTHTLTEELIRMLDTDHAILVPQAWSVITALLKGSMIAKHFPSLPDWLNCFNMCIRASSEMVRAFTNVAFGVLIYAVNITEIMDVSWSKIFLVLPFHQLQNPRRGQSSESAYCLLLYYALNPSASSKQLDRYWKEFVVDFWTPSGSTISPLHAAAACRIVSSLLDGSRKPWDSQRALDLRPQALMQRGELPLLDPRWVRKSLASVLPFVEMLLDATPWTTGEDKDEPAKKMWQSLLQSLNAASSQEVMASADSKDAMASIVNSLRRMWDTHAAQLALSQQKDDNWANKFCYLMESTVQKLGALAFTDKCLAQNQKDEIEVASTPSRSRQQVSRISPLLYFVDLLANRSEGRLADTVRLRTLSLLVEPCFHSQNTRLTKLEILRDCCAAIVPSSEAVVSVAFWTQIGALAQSCLGEQTADSATDSSRQLGKEYEIVVQIMSLGCPFFLGEPVGQELLTSFVETVRREAGEGGVVLAAVEKVSESILNTIPEAKKRSGLSFLSILLQNVPVAVARRSIEQGRQQLWPSSSKPGRNPEFDPYKHLYTSITSIGSAVYHQLSVYDVEECRVLLKALTGFVRSCPTPLLAVFLRKLQQPIRLWVEDADKRLQVEVSALKELHVEVVNLWKEICAALERLQKTDSQTLHHLADLVIAGFVSRRRSIVNVSVSMWNSTFGKQESLKYPTELEDALQRLQPIFQLTLPSLKARETGTDAVSFYDSDGNSNTPVQKFRHNHIKESPFRIIKNGRKSRSPAVTSSATGRRKSARVTPKARLRHDDSQIEFQPIAHPPALVNQESQVLTERQREMVDRQAVTSNLFAAIGTTSSPVQPKSAPMIDDFQDIHSDASVASDLPVQNDRTPVRRIPPVGPMDVFVGSSPTPHVRNRNREVRDGDRTSLATPTIARVTLSNTGDSVLGSSPPRVDHNATRKGMDAHDTEYEQPDESLSMSFDEGTTIDETTVNQGSQPSQRDITQSDMPSSSVDLQLDAQFDADMQSHQGHIESAEVEVVLQNGSRADTELVQDEQPHSNDMGTAYDTEVDEEKMELDKKMEEQTHDSTIGSVTRVEDSFSSYAADAENSQAQPVRRSARTSSAALSSAEPAQSTKRARGRPRKSKPEPIVTDEASGTPGPATPGVQVLDNIVVSSPTTRSTSARRTRSSLPGETTPSRVSVPESLRRRGVRRSASALSQMKTQTDTVVDGTPTPKRARANIGQDVSEAKRTPSSQPAQAKRLSHVRVTPKSARTKKAGLDVAPQASDGIGSNITTAEVTRQDQKASQSQSQLSAQGETDTPSRSFADRVILTPRSILNQLKNFKDALVRSSQLVLGRREEREIDDTLFDIRREIYAAGRRSEEGKQ